MNNRIYNQISIKNEKDVVFVQKRPRSSQSADTFFHFVDKPKFLNQIIFDKKFYARYSEENFRDFNIDIDRALVAMKCFCDIPLHRVKEHKDEYGSYCIGMTKEWGLKVGLQPVLYYNAESEYPKIVNKSFITALNYEENDDSINMTEVLNYNLKFQKSVYGHDRKTKKAKDFTDEKEWRYVPKLSDDLDISEVVINETILNNDLLKESYNKVLKEQDCFLSFDYDDIKYIFVKTDFQRKSLIKKIKKLKNETEDTKNKLITRICVWEEMEEDF